MFLRENVGFFKGGESPTTQTSMHVGKSTSQEGRCE